MKSLYFIAILPPEEIAAEVTKWKEYMRDHFESSRALKSPAHITLFAPFWMAATDEKELEACVAKVAEKHRLFRLDLNGFKAFPPRVIYIAPEYSYPLDELQGDVRSNVNAFLLERIKDFEPDKHSFNPHMTIAYRDLTKENFMRAWPEFENRPFHASFIVNHVYLLRHDRQKWVPIASLPLIPSG
jgi:2'-5' RNA ligase